MNPAVSRPMSALLLAIASLCFAEATEAKSLKDNAGWFGPGGKASQFQAEIDGVRRDFDATVDYMSSSGSYERDLAAALAKLSPSPSITGNWCELDEEGGRFRYHTRNPYRPVALADDWSVWEGADRNTRWRHHGLGMAGCYLKVFESGDRERGAMLLKGLVKNWYAANAVASPPDPEFSWGNHSTPIRLRQTIAIYLLLRRHGLADRDFTADVLRIAYSHTRILLEDPDIRMRRSNHALDQAHALFLSAAVFPFLKYSSDPLGEAQVRADYEANYLVAPDGVQTENSPEYHRWVPNRTFSLLESLSRFQDTPFSETMQRRMTGATRFAAWITRPDGKLPQLGDTGRVPQTFRAPKGATEDSRAALAFVKSGGEDGRAPLENIAVFESSGYLIHRDAWSTGFDSDDLHMVFKCGFLSSGHRHDDDGNIVLYSHGEDWLIDAGLFGYENSRPEREYVRSPLAHNVSIPIGMRTTRRTGAARYKENRRQWGLTYDATRKQANCRSFMYSNAEYFRDLSLEPGAIGISDRFERMGGGIPVMSIFRFPPDKHIDLGTGQGNIEVCSIADPDLCLRIDYDTAAISTVDVSRGTDQYGFSLRTTDYLKTEDIQTVRLIWNEGVRAAAFRVHFPRRGDETEAGASSLPAIPASTALLLAGVVLAVSASIPLAIRRRRRRRA